MSHFSAQFVHFCDIIPSMKVTRSQVNPSVVVCEEVQRRLICELGKMGLGAKRIGAILNLDPFKVSSYLPEEDVPDRGGEIPQTLLDKILYDYDQPLAVDVIVENEKQRYAEYSKLEKASLRIMNSFLEVYGHSDSLGLDPEKDKFVANMAKEFIKVTQSARQELVQKYALDKEASSADNNTLKVEFV